MVYYFKFIVQICTVNCNIYTLYNAPINVKPQRGGGGVGHRWGI